MTVNRRLVAVVVADVVGYSRLMERDEAGTHERLRKLKSELIDPKVAEHGGRTVKTTGDGMLVEFPSATSALRCAVEIQREMGVRNLYVAPDDKIQFRVGINLGDIIVEGDDILGDGVNVAARLETLADPGGICVASAVWEQVHEDLGVEFVDSGEQRVKNISKPIRVFRVALGKGASARAESHSDAPAVATAARMPARPRLATAAGVVALIGVVALAGWYFGQRTISDRSTVASGPPARSLIVLPLATGGDAAISALADTLTADITRALADSMRDVQVVAPTVATAYKGKAVDHRAVARDLSVRYLLEGDVTSAGDEVAVTLRLIDGASAKQLGSERKSVASARLVEDQQLLLARLAYASRDLFENAERRRIAAISSEPASVQDLVARANWVSAGSDAAAQREARKLFDEALKRDPSSVAALTGRASTYDSELALDFSVPREPLVAALDRDSSRVLSLDDRDPLVWHARSQALTWQWRYDAAFEANDRARARDPTRFFLQRTWLLILTGRSQDALTLIDQRAAMIGGNDPIFRWAACDAYTHLGQYARAIEECERGAAGDDSYWIWLDLTAAYAQTGDMTKAAAAKAELMRRVPTFTISRFEARQFSNHPKWVQEMRTNIFPGLRKAGVPE